jgi:hypothetical protein
VFTQVIRYAIITAVTICKPSAQPMLVRTQRDAVSGTPGNLGCRDARVEAEGDAAVLAEGGARVADSWSEAERALSAKACHRRGHDSCPHLFGIGGGFNPRRLRLESGAGLCGCSCHSSCPVTMPTGRMTVPMATWYQTCTCPGAEPARRDMPDALIRFPQPRGLRERIKVLYRLIQAGG